MLTREVMGVLALGILWVNTLLVVAAALGRLRAIRALGRSLVPVVSGQVTRGPLARYSVEQVGRAAEGPDAIVFSDRAYTSAVLGGAIEPGGPIGENARAEVWVGEAEVARAAACPGVEAFDAAFRDAKK